jgi:type IV fimbrial biogenesis protein FimT
VLRPRTKQQGVTLIELMIGLVIVGILFAAGGPAYSTWIKSQQVRTAAESILNGIQLARSTAVNNNAPTRFNLCDTSSSWQVLAASSTAAAVSAADATCGAGQAVSAGNEIRVQERTNKEGSSSAGITANSTIPAPTTLPVTDDGSRSITFDSFGRVVSPNADASNPITTIMVGAAGGARSLLVIVQTGGGVRMCDPSALLSANDPRHC